MNDVMDDDVVCFVVVVSVGWLTDGRWWEVQMDIEWQAVIPAGYNAQKVDTKNYCVTAHLMFPDPEHENHGNYCSNRGNYRVIMNQESEKLKVFNPGL